MKITGDDDIGKAQLDNFINPKKAYPVIATSWLMVPEPSNEVLEARKAQALRAFLRMWNTLAIF